MNRAARFLDKPLASFGLMLVLALLLRCDTFGDPNLHGDEMFYHTVGVAMHHGALPYVDVWDRKPFGLFVLYWAITGISSAPIAYQLVATLFAAMTATVIGAMAREWAGPKAGLIAGTLYLIWLPLLQGFGGQSPVFYNLFIASAALLVWRALPRLRQGQVPLTVSLAMVLAGLGITIKTTAFAEAVWLGLLCCWALRCSRLPTPLTLSLSKTEGTQPPMLRQAQQDRGWIWRGIIWTLLGALPTLVIAASYLALGHWSEYWHAMVISNLAKPPHLPTSLLRLEIIAMLLSPLLVLAAVGACRLKPPARPFLLGWLVAALAGLCLMPNFYLHYGIPMLLPLCIGAGVWLAGTGIIGLMATVALAAITMGLWPPLQFQHTQQSQQAMDRLVTMVKKHDSGRGLLTYEGPSQLYTLTGKSFATPLVFPTHLSALIEKDVSHLSTLAEMRRALDNRPSVIVMADPIRNKPVNEDTNRLVDNYVTRNCHLIGRPVIHERLQDITLAVWGDCG